MSLNVPDRNSVFSNVSNISNRSSNASIVSFVNKLQINDYKEKERDNTDQMMHKYDKYINRPLPEETFESKECDNRNSGESGIELEMDGNESDNSHSDMYNSMPKFKQ